MFDPEQDTGDYLVQVPFAESFFASDSPSLAIEFGGATDQGKVRANNEDQFAILRRRRSMEVVRSSLHDLAVPDDISYSLVVADGVGGSKSGEVASSLAIQTMVELSGQATSWVMKLTNPTSQQIQERAEAYLQRIQETLLAFSRAHPSMRGMGTTWTSAHLLPPFAIIVHVGDSRAYQLREGHLQQITRDETMAQAYIDAGFDPRDVGKYRRVLLNSLGNNREDAIAQIHFIDLAPGDRLLLCTDGLYEMVSDEDIRRTLERDAPPQELCDALIRQALDAGGNDNVTVALAVVKAPPE